MSFLETVALPFVLSALAAESFVVSASTRHFPGSSTPQKLKEGDVVLMDGGCSVDGYQSDITRTFVFGSTPRQREIWNLERRSQDAGLRRPCQRAL